MNIEIKITADNIDELQAALAQLGKKQSSPIHITCAPTVIPEITGDELAIPAGTDMKVAEVKLASDLTQEPMKMPEPEKPKRKRVSKQAAEMLAESPQEPAEAPAAPQAPVTPAEPEPAAVKPVEPAAETWETMADHPAAADIAAEASNTPTLDEIAAAGAALLDADSSKMMPLLDLLREHGVQAITQLKPEQLGGFAARLRALGAEV